MIHLTTKNDAQIRQDVLEELRWDPRVDDGSVHVAVADGIVALTGSVPHYAAACAAVDAARRVQGVLAVTDGIAVRERNAACPTDALLREVIDRTLAWNVLVHQDRIHVTVEAGRVTLDGTVDRWSEREDAEDALRLLPGVRTIMNRIEVSPNAAVSDADIRRGIEAAFERHAACDTRRIHVLVQNGDVVLRGKVRTVVERRDALAAAAAACGVRTLRNEIAVDPYA